MREVHLLVVLGRWLVPLAVVEKTLVTATLKFLHHHAISMGLGMGNELQLSTPPPKCEATSRAQFSETLGSLLAAIGGERARRAT